MDFLVGGDQVAAPAEREVDRIKRRGLESGKVRSIARNVRRDHPGSASEGEVRRERLICLTVDSQQVTRRAFRFNERAHTVLSYVATERNKATMRNLIDLVLNVGLIALVGCSIVAALTIGARMSAGAMQAATPMSERPSLLDQGATSDPCHKPCMPLLFSTVSAPAGQGWG